MIEQKHTITIEGLARTYWSVEGYAEQFTPGCMPPPTHFISVNAKLGWHNNENKADLNNWGEFHEPDAVLIIVKSDMTTVLQELRRCAFDPTSIAENINERNVGLYAVWDYGDHQVIAGMDANVTGHSDRSQQDVMALRSTLNGCAHYFSNYFSSHYMNSPDNFRFLDESQQNFVQLYHAIQQRVLIEKILPDKESSSKSKM